MAFRPVVCGASRPAAARKRCRVRPGIGRCRGSRARSGDRATRPRALPARNGAAEPEEWLPRGHRFRTDFSRWSENQALARFVRDRKWCPVAITNSLCVNRVRVSQLLNTAEIPRTVLTGTRCYIWRPLASVSVSACAKSYRSAPAHHLQVQVWAPSDGLLPVSIDSGSCWMMVPSAPCVTSRVSQVPTAIGKSREPQDVPSCAKTSTR